jgi:hypothetical protein
MANVAVAEELVGTDELEELWKLNASETDDDDEDYDDDDEDDDEDDEDEDDEEEPEDMPHP